jgi:hypothetical protein
MSPLAEQISYTDLYARWEHGGWSAEDIDFSEDARQWKEDLTEFERRAAIWNYSLFFWGEEAVATDLSPFIMAAQTSDQQHFLMTQQVDEARHAVFFKRFMQEVCGIGDGTMASGLEAVVPDLTPGFRKVLSYLEHVSHSLLKDPSPRRLAQAITLYHLVVEATLAQPGQRMISGYLDERGLLPGFREGMENVSRDEERHVAFGVRLLYDLSRQDEGVADAVARLLRRVVPWTSQVLMPPGWDESYLTVFGRTFDEVSAEGVASLQGKLRAAGLPIESLPGPPVMLPGLTPLEVAARARELAQAGVIGEREGPTRRDPETLSLLFDTITRQVDPHHAMRSPTVLQWEFLDSDIPDWHIIFDRGTAQAGEGRVPRPDMRMRIHYQDFADVVGSRLSPARLVATGRMRLWGNPQAFLRLRTALPL